MTIPVTRPISRAGEKRTKTKHPELVSTQNFVNFRTTDIGQKFFGNVAQAKTVKSILKVKPRRNLRVEG